MAKENYISLKGQLRAEPKYILNKDTGEIKTAVIQLVVMRRDIRNRANDFSPRFDRPIIMSSDRDIIQAVQQLKLGDIAEVKGAFKTGHIIRRKRCPECGQINETDELMQVITPAYIGKCCELSTNLQGTDYLRHCAEISNIAKVIGRVCIKDDKFIVGETESGDKFMKYQIAVNRKLFDTTSLGADDHSDYPVVYSYNDVADKDEAMLCEGALIYVDGYVHTMEYDEQIECCECHKTFPIKTQRMNLTPYANEYLRDYKMDALPSKYTTNEADINDPELVHDQSAE